MKISEKWGTTEVDPKETEAFIKAWFHPEDDVLITLLPAIEGSGRAMSTTLKARDLAQATVENIESLGKFENNLYGIYFGVSPLREDHQVKLFSRGGKKDVREIYGVWADLDVKPGAFESIDSIYAYLKTLTLEPTIVVHNGGTGGVHAYWKLDTPENSESDLPAQWWAYLVEKAQGRDIDRLADSSRLMRLPGAVYYPKPGGLSGTVRVVANSGTIYSRTQIESLAKTAYENHLQKKSNTRAKRDQVRSDLSAKTLEVLGEGFNERLALAILENHIEKMDWDDILIPAGWTHLSTRSDGTRHWARPGSSTKSANTDYEDSQVMSLHSWSTETRLADLKEAGVALTKPVVLLRLKYNDDVTAMINDLKGELA